MTFDPSSTPLPIVECPLDGTRVPGTLEVERDGKRVSLPLASVSVDAHVARGVASVTVSQTYTNPFADPVEAVYIFPLAGGSAVQDFSLRVGDRTIRGAIKERGEARADYAQAIEEGRRAALLEQERDDVFTVQLGNLPPGEDATVVITYSEMLDSLDNGMVELRLPFVVAPRYIPGEPLAGVSVGDGVEPDTDVVRDASRITPPRLAPGFDPNVSLVLGVVIDAAGLPISDLGCTQHATRTDVGHGTVRVALARSDERLNRDFVLRWRESAKAGIGAGYFVSASATGETFGMITLDAPITEQATAPRDVLFVLDRSGSMGTEKMASAARACAMLVDGLAASDRFAILSFDTTVEWFNNAQFSPAEAANRERGTRYLRAIHARGGTEMNAALDMALGALSSRGAKAEGRATAIILLTDGEIGDESRILANIQKRLGSTRLFTVGIDTAVNDGFLKRAAKLGRGTATFVEPGVDLDRALVAISREIGQPVVSDIAVVAENGETVRLAPDRVPDLFDGRRATVFVSAPSAGRIRVTGRLAHGGTFDVTLDPTAIELPAIAHLWARARVTDLEDRFRIEAAAQDDLKREIIDVSVRHRVLSRFTAFIVVDEQEVVVTDGSLRHVVQPVEMPAMWGAQAAAPMERGAGILAFIDTASRMIVPDLEHRMCVSPSIPVSDESPMYEVDLTDQSYRPADAVLRDLREALDAIRAELTAGAAPTIDDLEEVLDNLRNLMLLCDTRLGRIVEVVELLLKALKSGDDPTNALAEVDKALAEHTNFWEKSI